MKRMGTLRTLCTTAALAGLMLGNVGAGIVLTPGPSANQNPPPQRSAPPAAPAHVTPTRTALTHRTDRESPDAPPGTTTDRETPSRTRTAERTPVTPTERGSSLTRTTSPRGTTVMPATPKVTHNPHVHAAAAAADVVAHRVEHVRQRLADDRRFLRERAHHAWHHYWDYTVWLEQNTGRGRIVGVVRDASGLAVFDAKVWLRDSAGRALRLRADQHVTLSNEGGTFTMRHVHRGVYSVWAKLGADMARSQYAVVVHPGHVAFAMVRMGA